MDFLRKEDLREIRKQTTKQAVENVLGEWIRQAVDSKIKPLVKMTVTLRAHKPYILAFWPNYGLLTKVPKK